MSANNFFGRGLAASYRAGAEHIRKINAAAKAESGKRKQFHAARLPLARQITKRCMTVPA